MLREHGANTRITWSACSRRGQPLEAVRGFANKLPEHAARIAAVLTLVDDIGAHHIDKETFERAVRLSDYYTNEALRLFEAGLRQP